MQTTCNFRPFVADPQVHLILAAYTRPHQFKEQIIRGYVTAYWCAFFLISGYRVKKIDPIRIPNKALLKAQILV